ncbi:protein POF1B isoform X2 [Megalops cyprinoides]|uniref:protein POF1B isoform X2 n=1 Tax=Megalops cyprinoides TaxID=118141 RepID=UPI0018640929|nr:protein POF1B isoform X2 [Megalops cyprinoides]
MSLPFSHGFSTLRTVSVSSDQSSSSLSPSVQYATTEVPGLATYKTVSLPVSPAPLSHLQYSTNGAAVDGNMVYETVRYLVPVERRAAPESYVLVNSAPQVITQAVSPVYLQNVRSYSVNNVDEVDIHRQQVVEIENLNGKAPSVFSQASSPTKSPEPVAKEVEVESSKVEEESVVETVVERVSKVQVKTEVPQVEPVAKLDTRFFGELLAEVYRKNCDIHSCISEHVAKIRGRKHLLDPTIDYKVDREEVEALIPKGMSELTKQQIRYLLQTRLTADKTMRLLLTTFSSLREELVHLQDDLRRLENEKEELEKDLSFKADQAMQYDRLLEAVRENNRQLQVSLKESSLAQRSLENQLLSTRSTDSSRDFRIKELEGSLKALQQENEMLRQKMAGQCSTLTLQTKTEELSKQYNQMLSSLREEKDKELQSLRSQLLRIQTEYSTVTTNDNSLQLRITELLTKLEQRESIIKRQEEEIRRLQQERSESSKNITKTVITKKYRNQYPILGLLSDDYQALSPVKEAKTIVIERTGEIYKQEIITTP